MNKNFKRITDKYLKQILIVGCFAFISLAFYHPLLQGKVLFQSDISQYNGMSRQLIEYRQDYRSETYWIDNAFMGMPTYQLGVDYPSDVLKPAYQLIRILPRPAHSLFLYFLSMYALLLVLKINWKYAILGSLAFGFSTYLLIILQVGHNTKALAIGYIPLVMAGMVLLFEKKWFLGFLLTCIAFGLQIRSNHYQMTYYLLFLMGIFLLIQGIMMIKNGELTSYLKSLFFLIFSGIIALGFNATDLLATSQYASFSTRGQSELTLNPDGQPREISTGLDYNYITQYSYGLFESLNLIFPRIQGGGTTEALTTNSHFYQFLIQNGLDVQSAERAIQNVPTYWGHQPILEAPAYIGITIFFLAILGLFIIQSPLRTWLCVAILFSLLMSWGKNFPLLTNFFIDYVPFYNKFRAVSSIQIILQICFPVLAISGLYYFMKSPISIKKTSLLRAIYFVGGLCVFLLFIGGFHSFQSPSDAFYSQSYGPEFVQAIIDDRKAIYHSDLIRGLIYTGILSVVLLLSLNAKIKKPLVVGGLGMIIVFDLLSISNRYIERDLFVSQNQLDQYYELTNTDRLIHQDTTRFRVFNLESRLVGARDAIHHHSLGGYHAAKPRRLQELEDYGLLNHDNHVFPMLNVKYFLYRDPTTKELTFEETPTFGSAWFIDEIEIVDDYDQLIKSFDSINFRNRALMVSKDIKVEIPLIYNPDSLSTIELVEYRPNFLKYQSTSLQNQFAVFSEMFYPQGWELTINGVPTPIMNVNYVLRGAFIPSGINNIEFRFDPKIVQYGTKLSVFSGLLFLGVLIGFLLLDRKPLFLKKIMS
ncbi:MAG: hypothetical protein OXE77_02685 [Flavobacteriaceae bacterium]|nr:hypothetical protein [Flavobacteriaceae bacterium]MCY4267116.1 hypothetical protein [Flavobacteriaceae bacterium]